MKLLTKTLRSILPPLYSLEQVGDPTVWVKFFTPDTTWSWYATEGSPVDANGVMLREGEDKLEADFLFFGLVVGQEIEPGYFSLRELQRVRGPLGLPIEQDLSFKPCPLSKVVRGGNKVRRAAEETAGKEWPVPPQSGIWLPTAYTEAMPR
jgi:hypothetical protein